MWKLSVTGVSLSRFLVLGNRRCPVAHVPPTSLLEKDKRSTLDHFSHVCGRLVLCGARPGRRVWEQGRTIILKGYPSEGMPPGKDFEVLLEVAF